MTDDDRRILLRSPAWGLPAALAIVLLCLAWSGTEAAEPSPAPAPNARLRAPKIPVPLKIHRYCQRLVEKYDASGDGKLDQSEWSQMQGNPRTADLDRDGFVTAAELADRIARYGRRRKIRLMPSLSGGRVVLPSLLNPTIGPNAAEAAGRPKPGSGAERPSEKAPPSPGSKAGRGARRGTKFFVPRSQLPRGLPSWFVLRDADGDAQLTMAEFAPKPTQAQFDEFARYDRNRDGLVTAQECAQGPRLLRGEPSMEKGALEEGAEEAFDETIEERAEAAAEEAAPDAGTQADGSSAAKAAALKRSRKSRSKKLLKPSSKKSGSESG
jgi:hypothetical protein